MKQTPKRVWAKQPRVDLTFIAMKAAEPQRGCAVDRFCASRAAYTLAGRPWLPVCAEHAVAITARWESERGSR